MTTAQSPAHRAGNSKTSTFSLPGSKPSRHLGRALVHGRYGRNKRPDKHNATVDFVEYEWLVCGLGISEGIRIVHSKPWFAPVIFVPELVEELKRFFWGDGIHRSIRPTPKVISLLFQIVMASTWHFMQRRVPTYIEFFRSTLR